MPLFKLLELLEIRFHINVPCSEVIKLKDISKITEERAGRVIHLMPDVRTSPNSSSNIVRIFSYSFLNTLRALEVKLLFSFCIKMCLRS